MKPQKVWISIYAYKLSSHIWWRLPYSIWQLWILLFLLLRYESVNIHLQSKTDKLCKDLSPHRGKLKPFIWRTKFFAYDPTTLRNNYYQITSFGTHQHLDELDTVSKRMHIIPEQAVSLIISVIHVNHQTTHQLSQDPTFILLQANYDVDRVAAGPRGKLLWLIMSSSSSSSPPEAAQKYSFFTGLFHVVTKLLANKNHRSPPGRRKDWTMVGIEDHRGSFRDGISVFLCSEIWQEY